MDCGSCICIARTRCGLHFSAVIAPSLATDSNCHAIPNQAREVAVQYRHAYFVLCLGAFIVASLRGYHALQDKTVPLILTSFLLQNTVYIALHWAFRPENLFSSSFIEALSNPLGSVLGLLKKH